MKHWQNLTKEDKINILNITSEKRGLPADVIEKDWWVTATLYALSKTKYFSLMSFKGGTSLSKGYGLINRFSEDIDISLARRDIFSISDITTNQFNKTKRKARHYIIRELPIELDNAFKEMDISGYIIVPETKKLDKEGNEKEISATTNPSTVFVVYESILPQISDYFEPRIKIEIGCMNMEEPLEVRTISSILSNYLREDEDMTIDFPTVVPSRTFLEKIFLLHEEFQKANPRSKRMSRHLYDIEKLMDSPYGLAIEDDELFKGIIKHRSVFNKMNDVDYDTHQKGKVSFIPPNLIMKEWEKDYNALMEAFIYDENKISFADLINRLEELQVRLRKTK